MNKTFNDPVCHMQVTATSFSTEYAGIHYVFCSAQCKERFLSSPHLYVGLPGHKAPAQRGKSVIKSRRFSLSSSLDAKQAAQVKHALFEMMGIRDVSIDGDNIEIQYDLIQATAEQIADKLGLIGANLGEGWKDLIKLAFINYLEECEIDNLEIENNKGCH